MEKNKNHENDTELHEEVKVFLAEKFNGNINLYIKAFILIGVYFSLYTALFLFSVPLWILVCMGILAGIAKSGIGMGVMHDANHRSFSQKEWVNLLFGSSIYFVGGYGPNWNEQHNLDHHSFTNSTEHDSDLDTRGLFRFSPHQPLRKGHKYQAWYAPFFYSIMTLFWCTWKDFGQAYRYYKKNRRNFKKIKNHLLAISLSKIGYFVFWIVIPGLFWKVSFWYVLVFFLCMHLTAGLFLSLVFQPAHVSSLTHFPKTIEFNREEHQIRTTCNFAVGNRFVTWLTGGLNYQIEHHIFPYISHVHYPKISKIVQRYCKEKNIPYNNIGGFGKAIVEHFKYLHKLGNESHTVEV